MGVAGRIAAVVGTVLLAVCLVGGGYAVVAMTDGPTVLLSTAFSGNDNPHTPFSKDELVSMAVAGKRYSFDDNDRAALDAVQRSINEAAAADGRAGEGAPDFAEGSGSADAALASADEVYVLTPDALSHLDDCYAVASTARTVLLACLIGAVVCLALAGATGGRRRVGAMAVAAGSAVLAIFLALGLWAALDFDGMFAAFHGLFFTAGTWTFSWESLLITMYPIAFWMGMGAIWVGVTALLSALAIACGALLRRRAKPAR